MQWSVWSLLRRDNVSSSDADGGGGGAEHTENFANLN